MTRRSTGAAVCTVLAALAAPAVAQDSAAVRTARITYLTGASAYLDAGRLEGLREADTVRVVRGNGVIGVLRVSYLASHKASCDIVSTSATLAVGDTVRFVPAPAPRDSGVTGRAPSPALPPTPGASRSAARLRGRVGVEYLVMEQSAVTGRLSQPALGVRLDGSPFGGAGLNLAVDVRARRTYTILGDGTAVTDGHGRVYAAALAVNSPGSPTRLTFGRQISGALGSIGLFDGVLAELHQPGWSTGVFTGTQPEPLELGFSTSIVQLGWYAQRHSRPAAQTRWAMTLGMSGSYQAAHANREFAWMQGSYLAARLSAFVTQEVDYYRPWKVLPGMHPISLTSTFAFFQYRATDRVSLDAGFDNRRNVRLYRDVVNPETNFDDTNRQGAWAGVSLRPARGLRLGFDTRLSSGGSSGSAHSYTVSLGVDRISRLGATLRTRTTYYTNPQLNGWLQSAALGFDPGTRLHLELNGGVRSERDPAADPPTSAVTWIGTDLDVTLARAWYVMVSATRQRGGVDGYDQIFGGLSYRF